MSQRKAKEYRQAMEQYRGVVVDVDDLKRRIGAMEARHRREDRDKVEEIRRRQEAIRERADLERAKAMEKEEAARRAERRRKSEQRRRAVRRRRITAVACLGAVLLAMVWAIAMACAAAGEEETALSTPVALAPVSTVTPEAGEDPLEAEKIEAALLEQGYFSDAIPLPYDLQDTMRTACEEYGCPYPLALAVAEVESNFDMEAVGAVGEVGVMQLNPGPENTYWINLQAETNQDPTTPAGNIVCGVYLLGTHLINYEDTEKALMAYNMGPAGALQAWEAGVTSTEYTERSWRPRTAGRRCWVETVQFQRGEPGADQTRGGGAGQVPPLAGPGTLQGGPPGPWGHRGAPRLQPGRDPERGGGVAVRLGDNPGRRGVGRRSGGAGGQNAYTY